MTTTRQDRVKGVLTGQAAGDALGVHYETGIPSHGQAEMLGGGYGFAPGEWSDDSQQAIVIAQARSDPEKVAAGMLAWYKSGPADVGPTASAVLSRVRSARGMAAVAREVARSRQRRPGTISNGALMRCGPTCLPFLGDRRTVARVARRLAYLTHYDVFAGDACVLWSLAIERAVERGSRFDVARDMAAGVRHLPPARRGFWQRAISEALESDPEQFVPNLAVVPAFQAALSVVAHAESLPDGLQRAVAIGGDTDTIGAIAGALLGAIHGASAVPDEWWYALHGWPGLRARDLERLALDAATPGEADVPANYHPCKAGRHWGPRGAAGIIAMAEHEGVPHVLLAKRSQWVQQGSTWSTIGGAVDQGETAWQAAKRELAEEAGLRVARASAFGSVVYSCPAGCGWTYETFLVRLDAVGGLPRATRVRKAAWETASFAWVPLEAVAKLPLHPGFAVTWPQVRSAWQAAIEAATADSPDVMPWETARTKAATVTITEESAHRAMVRMLEAVDDISLRRSITTMLALELEFTEPEGAEGIRRTCAFCGRPYRARSSQSRYCSTSHRQSAFKKRKRQAERDHEQIHDQEQPGTP